jgi:hypothetical protein
MRFAPRLAVLATLVTMLGVMLPVSASAARLITYRGETSAPNFNDVEVKVLKRDNGRRSILQFMIETRIACEDGTAFARTWIFGRDRMADDGSFRVSDAEAGFEDNHRFIHLAGQIRFRNGSGSFIYNEARLTSDGMAVQMCTTGELTWTVDRVRSSPAASATVLHSRAMGTGR